MCQISSDLSEADDPALWFISPEANTDTLHIVNVLWINSHITYTGNQAEVLIITACLSYDTWLLLISSWIIHVITV